MRASDRFDVADVTCRLTGRDLRVTNLSVGGLYVEDRETAPPPPGQFVELELHLPGRPAFRLVGKVAWRRDARGGHPGGFGVQITKIALRDKLTLVDRLRRQPPPDALAGSGAEHP